MFSLFEKYSWLIAFFPVWAIAYHFTDSYFIVLLVAVAYYFVTTMLGKIGIYIQFLIWIPGAIFLIIDKYHIAVTIIYFFVWVLYVIRTYRVLKEFGVIGKKETE